MDEEFWAPDGSGAAVTITFNPENGKYNISEGIVNDMTFGNGSVAEKRTAEGVQQCYLYEMGQSLLFSSVKQTIGDSVKERSATYKNSSYTVFIRFKIVDGTRQADVYGLFNGTNLHEGCPAAIGSNTSSYDEENKPISTTPSGGHQNSNFTNTDLMGGGSFGPNRPLPTYRQCKNGHTFDEANPVLAERCVCTVCYTTEHKFYETGPRYRCKRCEYVKDHNCIEIIGENVNKHICNKCNALVVKASDRGKIGFKDVEGEVLEIPTTFVDINGQKYWVVGIGFEAFSGCNKLSRVEMPNTVKIICNRAFYYCEKLASVSLPSGLYTLCSDAFRGTPISSITIPVSVKGIYPRILFECDKLKTINYEGTVKQWSTIYRDNTWIDNAGTKIVHCSDGCINNTNGQTISGCSLHAPVDGGLVAFSDGTNLTWHELRQEENRSKYNVYMGEFNNIIPQKFFEGNRSLTEVELPDIITEIGGRAFMTCPNLRRVTIPNSVTTIYDDAFRATGITEITIPSSVTRIRPRVFFNCRMVNISYTGTIAQWEAIEFGDNWDYAFRTNTIHCSDGCIDKGTHEVIVCPQHPNP